MYKKVTIYYFTGTGNSYRVASWMREIAVAQEIDTHVTSINSARPTEEIEKGPENLLGLIFPTHGFTAPWYVIYFALRLPRRSKTHAFVTPTRAGTKIIGFLPGMEGTAGYLIALILLLKGYTLQGVQAIDMPSNWMALHWGLHPINVTAIIERARNKTTAWFKELLAGRRKLGGFIPLLLGLALIPVSFGYLIYGRFYLAKIFFASEKCNGCGLCVKYCPTRSLTLRGEQNKRPFWSFACESCMRCMGFCPQRAIEASQPFAWLLGFLTSVPVSYYLLKWLTELVPGMYMVINYWPGAIINYAYFLLSVYLAYHLFNWLIRVPLINKLFTYSTLTHYYRRYHEPRTKLKDLQEKENID
ncbi:MAG: 4Fe-4S binding protein [Syntrophomonadaceae bacterium]|nr:4Fe-4S binding protein [Syntrophomonadaceae bacterium]